MACAVNPSTRWQKKLIIYIRVIDVHKNNSSGYLYAEAMGMCAPSSIIKTAKDNGNYIFGSISWNDCKGEKLSYSCNIIIPFPVHKARPRDVP